MMNAAKKVTSNRINLNIFLLKYRINLNKKTMNQIISKMNPFQKVQMQIQIQEKKKKY